MAPPNKCILIAFLVAFALVTPNLQASAAISAEGIFKVTANAVQEAAGNTAAAPPPYSDLLPPQPTECRPLLTRMMPCAGFLTNSSVYVPESTCCDGFNTMFQYDTVTCLCHVVNGDIGQLLPAPMHHMRMVELFFVCGHDVRLELLSAVCNITDVPPMDVPGPPPLAPLPSASPEPSEEWL